MSNGRTLNLVRSEIPNWEGWMRSHSNDDGPIDPDIVKIRAKTRAECHRRKKAYTGWIRGGVLADNPIITHSFGPINLPADPELFTSSRWNERRTNVPLPYNDETWRFVWRFWHGANSYRGIKAHIEQYGMRRPLFADMFTNYDPQGSKLIHRTFAFRRENLQWPVLILRTGNERILMAMYEWGWNTVPVVILVRDCGFDSAMSALWTLIQERSGIGGLTREINRSIQEKGSLDEGLEEIFNAIKLW